MVPVLVSVRAAHVRIDIGTGQQRAAVVQIARMQTQVHLRHQRGGGAPIGQRHRLRHQPHDVAGQLRHLRRRQRHARTQAPGLAHRRAGIQQCLVLRFVAAIAFQEATTGQLPDLLAHQLLFVVPIAQALLHGVGVVAQSSNAWYCASSLL